MTRQGDLRTLSLDILEMTMKDRRNADQARLLIRERGVGALATTLVEGKSPYASLVTYACDHQGQPIFLFSALSDHTRNIAADPQIGRAHV